MRAFSECCPEVVVHRQWMVTLHDLPDAGKAWDTQVPKRLLEDAHCGSVNALESLCGDVSWQAQLVRKGDVYRLTGRWQVDIERQCSRCNAPFAWHHEGETERDFRLVHHRVGEEEETGSCEYLEAPGMIDLIDVLREDIWLEWKSDVVCREDCKGLCPQCGRDLNRGACGCGRDESDHPFAVLRQMKLDA